jgi:hypothetical protein
VWSIRAGHMTSPARSNGTISTTALAARALADSVRVQAGDRLGIGGHEVSGRSGEQAGQALGARRPPRSLIARQPPLYHRTAMRRCRRLR